MSNATVTTSWIPFPRYSPDAKLRLFCLPHAGGSASAYRAWMQALPPSIAVHPIQLPGREQRLREKAFISMPALIDVLVPELQPFLDRPFAIFGHSMGAMIGYEVVRALAAQQGPQPMALFASGQRAPHMPDRKPPIYHLPEPAFTEGLRRLNGIPEEILQNQEFMQLLTPQLRADFQLIETYQYREGPPLGSPIIVMNGAEDPSINQAEIEGWRSHTTAQCSTHTFPGDHFYLRNQVSDVLALIQRTLQPFL
jgi:medium-chain acyl-[acyl-carrier-protein] hydrolase